MFKNIKIFKWDKQDSGGLFDCMNISVLELNTYVVLLKTGPPTQLFEQAKSHGCHLMLPSACHSKDAQSVHGKDEGKAFPPVSPNR